MQQIAFLFQSIFKNAACILHHLAFLVWLSARIFLCSKSCFQPLKPHFLMVVLPFLPCFSWLKKGLFIPLQWIYMLNRLAFSTKIHCVQHQNALRLAAYCTAFSTKTYCIQQQLGQNQMQITVICNANSYCLHLHPPPFSIKTNFRENRFFAARWAIGKRQGHFLC